MKGSTPATPEDLRRASVPAHRVRVSGRDYYVEPVQAGIHVYPTTLARGVVYPTVDAYDDWRDCVSQAPLKF